MSICVYCHRNKTCEDVSSCMGDYLSERKSFLGFTEFWLRVKVSSEHGQEVNTQIIKEEKRKIYRLIQTKREVDSR